MDQLDVEKIQGTPISLLNLVTGEVCSMVVKDFEGLRIFLTALINGMHPVSFTIAIRPEVSVPTQVLLNRHFLISEIEIEKREGPPEPGSDPVTELVKLLDKGCNTISIQTGKNATKSSKRNDIFKKRKLSPVRSRSFRK